MHLILYVTNIYTDIKLYCIIKVDDNRKKVITYDLKNK